MGSKFRWVANKKTYLHGNRESDIMIKTFRNKTTADLYHGRETKAVHRLPPNVKRIALRKFDVLNAAHALHDLREPPGNRLKLLKGDFFGYHSIRVNDQWRIIFRWKDNHAYDVSLIDYH